MSEVAVLAVQGGVAAHVRMVEKLGLAAQPTTCAEDVRGASAIILPGGESTAQQRGIERATLAEPLEAHVSAGRPVLASCAGLILAARCGWLDIELCRNGWGRQSRSFEALDDAGRHRMVFIRAPRITAVGAAAEILATLDGEPVLVRQGSVVAACFHPELTEDDSIHRLALATLLVR